MAAISSAAAAVQAHSGGSLVAPCWAGAAAVGEAFPTVAVALAAEETAAVAEISAALEAEILEAGDRAGGGRLVIRD